MKELLLKKQKGTTVIEFTIVASLFFLLIFAIIEFGRLLFTWHVLNETSRRVARLASVCQVTETERADTLLAGIVGNVTLPNFAAENIQVRYLDEFGSEVPTPLTTTSNFVQIEFVEASIIIFVPKYIVLYMYKKEHHILFKHLVKDVNLGHKFSRKIGKDPPYIDT